MSDLVEPSNRAVLLVDSEDTLRQTEAAVLRDMGYNEILLAFDGEQAWSMMKNFQVDLVISSWYLPDMSGLVLLKFVRAEETLAKIPFVMLVDQATKAHVFEAGAAGVTDMIVRPFTRETFKKKIDQAIQAEADPQAIEAGKLHEKGLSLMKQGRYEEAVASFQRILNVYESAELFYNLGYIKTAQGRYEEAIMAFRRATQINNAFAQAYQKMGEAFAKMGRADEAQKCLEKAAEIFMDKKEDEKAEEVFMQILQVNPDTQNVYNTLGILSRRQGKFEEAIKMYRKALLVNPFDEHIHYNLARVYLSVKKFREAEETLRTSVKLNPDFVEAQELLKSLEMGEGI
ncbi:MAG: tetratricopeptide repeat protein [Pseudomonadota bacterium]